MQGFGLCVWWKLASTHPLVRVHRSLSEAWKTPSFEPHVSVRTRLSFAPSEVPHPPSSGLLALVDGAYTTEEYIPSWNTMFYAIEVPVQWAWPLPRSPHVSVAYRFDRPFEPKELALASELLRACDPDIVRRDMTAQVYDVTSKHVHEWANVYRL